MIAIIDYGIGNLASVHNMFKKIGVKEVVITKEEAVIESADKILLPGVGAFDSAMKHLQSTGLIPLLNKKVLEEKVPTLGICLGMQMMTKRSEEGIEKGLAWIDAETLKFNLDPSLKLKVPHMGWNYVKVNFDNPLIDGVSKNRFYFVHSYYVKCENEKQSLATSNYGNDFTCMVNKDNIFGAQFHPEKSLKFGMKVLGNFARL
jgi:imidazole glycerol-phosphate synthase subunit HisH